MVYCSAFMFQLLPKCTNNDQNSLCRDNTLFCTSLLAICITTTLSLFVSGSFKWQKNKASCKESQIAIFSEDETRNSAVIIPTFNHVLRVLSQHSAAECKCFLVNLCVCYRMYDFPKQAVVSPKVWHCAVHLTALGVSQDWIISQRRPPTDQCATVL